MPRYGSIAKSAGMRKSRSRRVAKRISPEMRETRKVRIAWRSRSWPTTYQLPLSGSSAYGLIVRSISSLVEMARYGKRTVRCFEIAASSLPRRPLSSGE